MSVRTTLALSLVCLTALLSDPASRSCTAQETTAEADEPALNVDSLPELPVGITSFGGARCDGHLYVYGGHSGAAHEYYQSGQNAVLYRLDLDRPKQWEQVNVSHGLQGLAMVAHGGKLYRLGGFEARNQRGEEQDLHSVARFEQLDPAHGEWKPLKPMPEPRSSFDAAVVGDTLYVVGGWALAGEGNTRWSDTAWSIDLSDPAADWQELPQPPFSRRALSVSFQGDRLYAIGGMQQRGGPTRNVNVYDTSTQTWSEGPALPGEEAMEGFGNSSFNIGGQLCVSTYGGHVYKLDKAGEAWQKIGSLETGRFFHRLLPVSNDRFALVGGANMETGKVLDVEVIKK